MKILISIVISVLLCFQAGFAMEPDAEALKFLREETKIATLMKNISDGAQSGDIAFRNVTIVDPDNERLTNNQTVIVSRTPMLQISWVGDDTDADLAGDMFIIDGGGRYLAPGLVDMHVHFESVSGMLLLLANGITTAREMNGFPWLLGVQRSAFKGEMLAPTLYIAGTIINGIPIGEYALVANSSAEVRRIIRQQAACGYDFIKVHNILPKAFFDAAVEQSNVLGMDLVGHVPQEVDISYALEDQKLKTMEHLKGFIFDRSFMANPEDFSLIMKDNRQWLTPTLRTRMNFNRSEDAQNILASDWAQYVASRKRAAWRDLLNAGHDEISMLLDDRMLAAQTDVMQRLVPLKPKWLVGTDAANEHFSIMGYALFEEMGMMHSAGVSLADIYRGATTEAARTLGQEDDFGKIEIGMRPDLVLLDKNPLLDPTAYQSNAGVMVNGLWVSKTHIQSALEKLAAIYSDKSGAKSVNEKETGALIDELEALQAEGYFFDSTIINGAMASLEKYGNRHLANRLQNVTKENYAFACTAPIPYEN